MRRRIAGTVAALALTLSLGTVAAPSASAQAPFEGGQGSVGLCLVIPIGSLVLPLCI